MNTLGETEDQMERTGSAPNQLPSQYQKLAMDLMAIHGSIRLARERSGLHFYLACPECLEEYGESELYKKHLAVNVDRYFAGKDHSAQCMKNGRSYNVTDLVSMRKLIDRGIEYKPEVPKLSNIPVHYLEKDDRGNFIPRAPGSYIPVHLLSEDHPARMYLNYRNFDPVCLWEQFRCCFCYRENEDQFYRKLPGGFKVTPQGRLIFFCYVEGVRAGWQARILEVDTEDTKFYFHPYKKDWVAVMNRKDQCSPWEPLPGYNQWDPAKYWTGPGTRRNSVLMGFDAAVNYFSNSNPLDPRWCGIVEGPLDAARLGPPFISRMGKHLSSEQAVLIRKYFRHVVVIGDNDVAGRQGLDSVRKQLVSVRVTEVPLPAHIHDPGDLSPEQAAEIRRNLSL